MAGKTRLRFTTSDDIDLLRAVSSENPFEDSSRWNAIRATIIQNTDKEFSVRALKEHLLKLFGQEDKANIKKSGTEEEYTEKKQLLQEISDMKKEFGTSQQCNNSISMSKTTSKKSGLQLRQQAASSYSDEVTYIYDEGRLVEENHYNARHSSQPVEETSIASSSEPQAKRTRKDNLKSNSLQFLINRATNTHEIETKRLQLDQQRLELEERRLNLDIQKFEIEKEERRRFVEVQIAEREAHISILQKQQDLLLLMMQQQAEKNKH